jgi:hypothetical protein
MTYDLSEAVQILQRARKAAPSAANAAAVALFEATRSALDSAGFTTSIIDATTFGVTLPGGALVVKVVNDKIKTATMAEGPFVAAMQGITYAPEEDAFIAVNRSAVALVVEAALARAGK